MTERLLSDFTPYEIGKITAMYHSGEQFRNCNALMKRVNLFHPDTDSFLLGVTNEEENKTYIEVSKRLIFACYLISRSAYKDLMDIGEEKSANAIDSMFQLNMKAA